jgi:dolichol-phosphate mannosyltransferase
MPDLSVVIPVHNEEDNIRLLIDEVRQSLDGVRAYEVIYVNDGSKYSALNILEEYGTGFSLASVKAPQYGQA